MLSLPLPVKIFWCLAPTDMRKSFDGLAALVTDHLRHDPLSGHLFIFSSKRRDRLKLLYYERGGYAIWYKRKRVAAPCGTASGGPLALQQAATCTAGGFGISLVACFFDTVRTDGLGVGRCPAIGTERLQVSLGR